MKSDSNVTLYTKNNIQSKYIQQKELNDTIQTVEHHSSYLFPSIVILIFIIFISILIYKKRKEYQLLKNSTRLEDIVTIDDESDREAIEEAIKNKDEVFLRDALNSPVLSEKNKKLIKQYFKNKN